MNRQKMMIYERLRRYFFIMSITPVLILAILLGTYIIISALNSSSEQMRVGMERTCQEFDRLLQDALSLGNSAVEDSKVIHALSRSNVSKQEIQLENLAMNNELGYISRYFDKRIQVYIIAENGAKFKNGSYSYLKEDYRQESWYQSILSEKENVWLEISEHSKVVHSVKGCYVSLGIPVYASGGVGRVLGVVLVEVRLDDLLSELRQGRRWFYLIAPNWEMQIVDEQVEQYENDIVTTFDEDGIQVYDRSMEKPEYVRASMDAITYWRKDFEPEGLLFSRRYVISYSMVDTNRWIMVDCYPYWELYRVPLIICGMMLAGTLILIGLVLQVSHHLAKSVTRPIKRLNDYVHAVGDGNFDLVIERTSDDEIGNLTDRFNHMVQRIRMLMDRIIMEQNIQRKYELLLLQAQINPHFLYNSLDSIVWMVRIGKNADAEIMLTALTSFFKTGLNKGNDTLELEQELINVQSYMTIQQYRYRTKLVYQSELDTQLNHLEVPKLILQPLVENAIYHGVKEKEGQGRILLRCWKDGNVACITVWDDGVGMSEAALDQLRSQMRAESVKTRNSYGILNVYERLRLFFQNRCSMEIDSKIGEGTCVTIKILLEASDEHLQSGDRR